MPVISGNGTEKTYLVIFAPRFFRAVNAEVHRAGNGVVHHIEAAAVPDYGFFAGSHSEDPGKEVFRLFYAVKSAVVAAVGAVCGDTFFRFGDNSEKVFRKIELFRRRLASRHIKGKVFIFI